jgi:two-component system chemotaxis response regulator CheY
MTCTILVVDDSPILRRAVTKAVVLSGIDQGAIYQANNGQEALDILECIPIDLVLLDLNMPIMDGEEFAKRLHQRDDLRDVAVVVVSAEPNRERLERMKGYGIIGTLHKPFEPVDLRRLIAKVLAVQS